MSTEITVPLKDDISLIFLNKNLITCHKGTMVAYWDLFLFSTKIAYSRGIPCYLSKFVPYINIYKISY